MSMHAIEGTWIPFKAELAGAAAPDDVLARTELVLRHERYEVRFGGEKADAGAYSLSPDAAPPSLTLHGKTGHNRGRTIAAIFQLQGDRLRICYGLDGSPPATFATTAGSQLYLVSYRRKI
jgi:uncharacterized protein (TIGR03067 family)